MVTGDSSGGLAFWEKVKSNLVAVGSMLDTGRPIASVAFADDGHAAVSAHDVGALWWTIDPDRWQDSACSIATRDLSDDERIPYSPDLDGVVVCSPDAEP